MENYNYIVEGIFKQTGEKAWADNGSQVGSKPEMTSIVNRFELASLWPYHYAEKVRRVWSRHEDYTDIKIVFKSEEIFFLHWCKT